MDHRFQPRLLLSRTVRYGLLAGLMFVGGWATLDAQVIPHRQEKPPNDPRDATTAAKLMTVPEGFTVEVVASEPEIVNPVAMAIDEKGRFWITESLEYPRHSAGAGAGPRQDSRGHRWRRQGRQIHSLP